MIDSGDEGSSPSHIQRPVGVMLKVHIPHTYESERRYVFDVLLGDFLGLEYQIETTAEQETRIESGGRQLVMRDGLFGTPQAQWLSAASLPRTPLSSWSPSLEGVDLIDASLPLLFGAPLPSGSMIQLGQDRVELGVDILGTCFFMLTRYEEVAAPHTDKRGRYPASVSLAARGGFLSRPVVHEYLEVLWGCMRRLWPGLERRRRAFRRIVSHDVDHPFRYRFGVRHVLGALAHDVRHNLPVAGQVLGVMRDVLAVRAGDCRRDPYYTFDAIMDVAERRGEPHAFYIFGGRSDPRLDPKYDVSHPLMRRLLNHIHSRGHEIGLHTSFHTYQDGGRIRREFEHLRRVCAEEGIRQDRWGVRQHFLRWSMPLTPRYLDEAGLDYDTTLGFADQAGFRTGACFEHAVYDLRRRVVLKLVERPLIAMECSVIDAQYMGMGLEQERAWEHIRLLEARCRHYQGDFTLLWHNSRMQEKREWALFERLSTTPPASLRRRAGQDHSA